MKTLGIVITDGVGFRNYVLSNFLNEAQKQFDSVVLFSCLPKDAYEKYGISCKIIELEVFEENFSNWFFRKAKEVAHMQLFADDYFGIKDNLKLASVRNFSNRGIATQFIVKWTSIFNSEKWIQRYNKLQQRTFANHKITKDYGKLLKDENIDLLFFTHQRPGFIAPMIYAAEKLRIETASFIFSWDNLASKGRMAGNFNHYLVWSHLMKSEMLHFYESVKPENVNVVGTPQFEPYVMPEYASEKADFLKKFNLNPDKKIICFSCADASIGANDGLVIATIANLMRDKKIDFPCQLLVRTSPAELPARFEPVRNEFPEIIWNTPKWISTRQHHAEMWSQRVPDKEDVSDLRAILEFSDLNINMCSTMSLDFMLFDKPVINTVFGNGVNGLYDDQRILKFLHYEKVVESNAVMVAKNASELELAINESLANPEARKRAPKFD
ncbi:hypothetical protein [Flavobacterium sp. 3HN19-14]|uniref:hypothetical protein n=1 Tax=Flavobacterium sp. 3HN19-14 TaxID=3448133 RepID=UPI003EE3228A